MVDKNTSIVIGSIKESLHRDSTLLPPFIEPKSTTHKMCAELAEEVIKHFLILIVDGYLNKKQIKYLSFQISGGINAMLEIDPGIALLYFEWFQEMLQAYKELCLVNELFESVVNIDKFIEEINKPV